MTDQERIEAAAQALQAAVAGIIAKEAAEAPVPLNTASLDAAVSAVEALAVPTAPVV